MKPTRLLRHTRIYLFLLVIFTQFTACGPAQQLQADAADSANEDAGAGPSVLLRYADQQAQVVLASQAEIIDGLQQARVSALIRAAFSQLETTSTRADFLAGDGFMPAHSPNCSDLMPVSGDKLDQAYVDIDSRALSWDEALQMPGCLYVNDLSEIILTSP